MAADTQLVMIIVVLFFTRYFLYNISLIKYYYSIITKAELIYLVYSLQLKLSQNVIFP